MKAVIVWLVLGYVAYMFFRKNDDKDAAVPCTVGDLELDWEEYEKHVKKALALLHSTMYDPRWTLLMKEHDGTTSPVELLAKPEFAYLENARSWVKDEFIPKIKSFKCSRPPCPSAMKTCRCPVSGDGKSAPVAVAERHLAEARRHAANVKDELHFFLTDHRSPFDKQASLYGGDCTARDVARWYVGGKHIVEDNFKRIDDALEEFVAFAKKNGAK